MRSALSGSRACGSFGCRDPGADIRLLLVSGSRSTLQGHWLATLARQYRQAVVLEPAATGDRCAGRSIVAITRSDPATRWVVIAHQDACAALATAIARGQAAGQDHGIGAAVFVAPADPDSSPLSATVPRAGLGIPAVVIVTSESVAMPASRAALWAGLWGAHLVDPGATQAPADEGDIDPLPRTRVILDRLLRRLRRAGRLSEPGPHPMVGG